MKKIFQFAICLLAIICMAVTCKKQTAQAPVPPATDTSLVNLSHLNYLYTPFAFANGTNAAAIYIYAEAPDYRLVGDADEGFTCVDDVARATQVYLRNAKFSTDTTLQNKTFNLLRFIVAMQSDNGYFYNFLFPDMSINRTGSTSINRAEWWSWRALYTLAEAAPAIRNYNPQLADKIDASLTKLIATIKADQVPIPQNTKLAAGITVPQWLPAGSGSDQAAIIILGLAEYAATHNDAVLKAYIKKLADGLAMMQQGDATHFPYGAILSWENTWHAYGADQPYALMVAGAFLNDASYTAKGMIMVDYFIPFLLSNGMKSSFVVQNNGSGVTLASEKSFEQIAYGIRPLVSAAAEAYRVTNQAKYADIAGHLAAWFLGANDAGKQMYSSVTGRGFDGIQSAASINVNSGAESTIEALLTMEMVEQYPAIKTALNKYKK